jgi:hypothetical protein
MSSKRFVDLNVADFRKTPVWEFVLDSDDVDELMVDPVNNLPVSDLSNRIVGVHLILADGTTQVGFLGNVSLNNRRANDQFLTVAVPTTSGWFTMSRYFDPDAAQNGPRALAKLLGKPVKSTFPIRYDISSIAIGDSNVLRGEISLKPKERLSRKERLQLAVS